MTAPTALDALPPSVGDAPVAALLLRDVVAGLVADGTAGRVAAAAVEVTDDGRFHLATSGPTSGPTSSTDDLAHASLAAPELFRGATPDPRTDVYAAACLALTRYLGTAPVAAAAVGQRSTAATRLGALRHAQRTVPARLGALPAPFRDLFARAVAKERYLRPTPAALVADLDAAFAASGGEAAARRRVHRLVVLARVFEPGEGSALRLPTAVPAGAAAAPLQLPIRSLPDRLPRRATRVALIAAVTVVATGGVAVAAVVGLSGSGTRPVPQAVATLTAPPTDRSSSPSAPTSSSAPAPATTVVPVVAASTGGAAGGGNADGGGNGGGGGTGGSTSKRYGSGSSGSGSGSSNRGPAPTPAAPPSQVASVPVDSPPAGPPASSDPGTPTDSSSNPTSAPPTSSDPPSTPDPSTSAAPSSSGATAATAEATAAVASDASAPANSTS